MNVAVVCNDPSNKCHLGTMTKEIDIDCVPVLGTKIEDCAWRDSKEITRVVLNLEDGNEYYYLMLEDESLDTNEGFDELETNYKECGWTVL